VGGKLAGLLGSEHCASAAMSSWQPVVSGVPQRSVSSRISLGVPTFCLMLHSHLSKVNAKPSLLLASPLMHLCPLTWRAGC